MLKLNRRCLGFFYLTVKSSGAECKAQVWELESGKIKVWDGENWYDYSCFHPHRCLKV